MPVLFPLLSTSRLHLPAPLRSPGITPARRYYGRCDCLGAAPALARLRRLAPAALPASRDRPSEHSVPKHRCAPAPPTQPLSGSGLGSGFATSTEARQSHRPNRVCHPTDCSFTSRCSPPPLARTQFLSVSGRSVICQEGLAPSDRSRSQAHIGVGRAGCPAPPPSEPCMRISRTRLSSRWFQHRDWLACAWAPVKVKSPCSAKKAFGQRA